MVLLDLDCALVTEEPMGDICTFNIVTVVCQLFIISFILFQIGSR
jgi:hypothetical protein